jgi:hypothetical protein
MLQPIPSAVIKAVSDARALSERAVATRLLEMLGPTLTTAIGDAKDTRAARQWAAGRHCYRANALRAALLATVAIAANYEAEGARSWFASTNPDLDWKSPLVFIRAAVQQEQLDRLVQVAAQDAR